MFGIKVDFRNYKRVESVGKDEISRLYVINNHPVINAVEIHLIPKDFESRQKFQDAIWDFGSKLKTNLKYLSVHYPWQYTFTPEEFDAQRSNLEFTIEQIDLLNQIAGPEEMALITHYQCEGPSESFNIDVEDLINRRREYLEKETEELKRITQLGGINYMIETGLAKVLIENNPPSGTNYHLPPGQDNIIFALSDMTPNDMKNHTESGARILLDLIHIGMWKMYYETFTEPVQQTTDMFGDICKKQKRFPNAELLRELSHGTPNFYQEKGEEYWLKELMQYVGEIHIAGLGGYTKEQEGIDLFAPGNKLDASIIRMVPEDIPIILERANSWKDLAGDIENIEFLQTYI